MDPAAFVKGARALFPHPPHRVVVACSGGADSVALLHLLHRHRADLGLEPHVLTCDHGLRPESGADAAWVQALADTLGLPCQLRVLPVRSDGRPGESLEMTARRLRRAAYLAAAQQVHADSVALAHHLDDQAETLLLRLCRGTGPRGAGGISPVAQLGGGVRLLRPLLDFRREELRGFLRLCGQDWREDASNAQANPVRNRLRLNILPELCAQVNPKTSAHLAAFAGQQRELEAWAAAEAAARLPDCMNGERLLLNPWRALPKPLRERILIHLLHRWGADPARLRRAALFRSSEALMAPLSESRKRQIAGIHLLQEGGELFPFPDMQQVRKGGLWLGPGDAGIWEPLGRKVAVQQVRMWDAEASAAADRAGVLTAFCRPAAAGLRLRAPERGDRYRPLGLSGTAKLSDLFINAGFPRSLRANWPVWVTEGDGIVWVPGFRVAEAWKAGEGVCWRLRMDA